jgi:DNA-binding response OmpR family regulator
MSGDLEHIRALDLALDHNRHRVTRGTRPPVDMGGDCRLWQVLTALCRRYDGYYPVGDLTRTVWMTYPAAAGTVHAAICKLRKVLRPLGLGIKVKKEIGYCLEILDDRKE